MANRDRRHVAITGASSGIGEAIARELSSPRTSLTLVARRLDLLQRLAEQLRGAVHVADVDLSRLNRATEWIAEAERALGPIDVLINNAGTVAVGPFAEIDGAEARLLIELDLVVPLLLTRAVLPGMLTRGHGVIVNVTSTGALAPNPGMVDYCAAKAGLAAASESLRGELRRTGVHVVTVYPGPTQTAMLRTAQQGYPRVGRVTALPTASAAELARRIRVAIDRRNARVIYPRIYVAFRYLPAVARRMLDLLTPAPLCVSRAS